jgi:hypothetical protein
MSTPRYVVIAFLLFVAAGCGLGALVVYRALESLHGIFG